MSRVKLDHFPALIVKDLFYLEHQFLYFPSKVLMVLEGEFQRDFF